MNIQLVRHATLRLQYMNRKFLIDPMLSPAGTLATTPNTPNPVPNPLVDLPMKASELLDAQALIVTHMHRDHFDDADHLLPRELPLFCQPVDRQRLEQHGFSDIRPVDGELYWDGIGVSRTGGQHGRGEIGKLMAPVSGFVLRASGEPTLYVVGDSIWCEEVEQALETHRPEVAVVFAGAAQFLTGGPITMTGKDIELFAKKSPHTKIVVAHMEAWNHCLLSRADLRRYLQERQLDNQVHVPENGEWMEFE
ncbi:MBL fold metallo-hydrolase [Brevibacillus sp. H7]|uniref:MBL fold metallo-hydrolase n=1 Tax=Brevibacillus sp. H7 TaxID=3349138 RepID=UPI0037F4059A